MKNNTKVKRTENNLIKAIKKNKKTIIIIALLIVIIYAIIMVIRLLKNPTSTFLVEKGQIYQEETATGYIIRDEQVIKGENYKNGMAQIKTEGERVAKGEAIFRYYSNGEETLVKKIEALDSKIDEAMKNNNDVLPGDTKVLENQITQKIENVHNESDLQKIKEIKKEMTTDITKKAKIAGDYSPAGSYLKKLIDERSGYERSLNSGAEYIVAPESGVVSYRVDGFEEILTTKNFSNISKGFLESLNLKTGQIVATSDESGKVINNYECYIATCLNSEYANSAELGDTVKLKLPSGNEVNAEIVQINVQNENNVVIVFKIEKCVEELIGYRKISFDVIWWSYSGNKIPNNAIQYEKKGENKVAYVIRTRAGYEDKILVKELKSNGKYTIVSDYTSQELEEIGYSSDEIKSRKTLSIYDEILLNK